MQSLKDILFDFVNIIHEGKCETDDNIHVAMAAVYEYGGLNDCIVNDDRIVGFLVEENEINSAIDKVEKTLSSKIIGYSKISEVVSYVLGELTCNILEHSMSKYGVIFTCFDEISNELCIVLSDYGKTIFGSYAVGRYSDAVVDDICALNFAQQGYSTKNLPDAENRGYGISTSIKMITSGLGGEFAIVSGKSALYNGRVLGLPNGDSWDGTVVMMKFSVDVPKDFRLYDYIS